MSEDNNIANPIPPSGGWGAKSPSGDLGVELRSEEFQEILGSVPPWILRWGITLLAAIVVILLVGSAFFKYPDVLSSQIVLTGSTPPAVIVAKATGKLKELYVADNQEVKTGEYLAVIDNSAKTEDVLKLKEIFPPPSPLKGEQGTEIDSLTTATPPSGGWKAKSPLGENSPFRGLGGGFGTLQSSYSAYISALHEYQQYNSLHYYPQKISMTKDRKAQYEKQYAVLINQKKLTEEQLKLALNKFQRDSLLNVRGVLSAEDLENSRNAYLQNLMAQENITSSLNSMQIQIGQLEESLLDTGHQDIETLNNLQRRLQSQLSQLQAEILNWELNYVLQSPIDGKITFANYWVENQNITAGSPVFTVVPTETLPMIGKAQLPLARSGKVKVGQKVNIRLQNFPENEYGILRGTVKNISLTPTQEGGIAYYSVEITLNDGLITTYKKELPYLPDMQGQADIITEDISLLERLILPIKKILSENI